VTLDDQSTIRLKRSAIEMTGLPAILGIAGMLLVVAGVVLLIKSWPSVGEWNPPVWAGFAALVAGIPLVVVGGDLHHRRYLRLARMAGLSNDQAEMLADQADREQDA